MSVMLIAKKHYIAAAGLVAGIKAVNKNDVDLDDLDLYFGFSDCYTLNFNSFYERYAINHKDVAEMRPDGLSYYDVFMEYKNIGIELCKNGKIGLLVSELDLFRDSSMYQIEEYDIFEEQAEKIYSRIYAGLTKYINKTRDLESWCHIDIDYLREAKSA